jgi:hypothetical protein
MKIQRSKIQRSMFGQSKFQRSIVYWSLLGVILLSFAATSFGQVAVGISVRFGPPAIPVYAQPICPGPGFFWTPGYWAWNDQGGYYWVPGTWILAPVGMLWTPGYWGFGGGFYAWHPGYWGPHVGFYGGINYGFGYGGVGFGGGEWRGGRFFYNRSVTNVSVTNVTNVYNRTVIVNNSHVSYNGGAGGIDRRATREEENWAHERHIDAVDAQREHERAAVGNRENFASENHGRPMYAATARPGDFSSHSVVAAHQAGGEYHPPAMSPREARVGAENHGGRPNDGYRPFTPPNKAGSPENEHRNNDARFNESRANENHANENHANENHGNPNHGGDVHNNVSHPQPQMHEQPRQSERAPKENNRPAPPPKHENAPPKEEHHQDDHHRGR